MPVKPQFKQWKWDLKKKKILAGTYVDQIPNLGKHHSTMYFIEQKGVKWGIWGNLAIKRRLQWLPIGTHVKIEFRGQKKQPNGFRVNDFKINYTRAGKKPRATALFKGKPSYPQKLKKKASRKGLAKKRYIL